MRLSRKSPKHLWVACSDGRVFHVDWTQNHGAKESFQTSSKTAHALAIAALHTPKEGGEVLIVSESDKSNKLDVVAYQPNQKQSVGSKTLLSLKKQGDGLRILETSEDGMYLVGALHERLFLGTVAASADNFEQLRYEFYSFDAPDLLTSIDIRAIARPTLIGKKKNTTKSTIPVVDVIAGGARGAIYRYHDALIRLQSLEKENNGPKEMLQAQNYHWHRKAVHAVKWSRDGELILCNLSNPYIC